jgi:hypothetical protein
MRIRIAVPDEHADPAVIDAALEAVTRLDESMIRSGQSPTSHQLVAAGAKWRPENMGDEHFDHGGTIAQRGWGDCDDWAPLHAATLRASGEDPRALARVIPSGPSTYHAVVQRGTGHVELGPEDISARAGMRPISAPRVVGSPSNPDAIECCALDPHDGRVYHGQLLPTVGPLSLHAGPQMSVRGAMLPGGRHMVYEGRCDLPMNGSPLLGARRKVVGRGMRSRGTVIPYALSSTACAPTPHAALANAIAGAVLCGDAAELAMALDRYKLVALQSKLAGMPAQQIAQSLAGHIALDVTHEAAAQGAHPEQLLQYLATELEKDGRAVRADVHDIARAITSLAGSTYLPRVVGR